MLHCSHTDPENAIANEISTTALFSNNFYFHLVCRNSHSQLVTNTKQKESSLGTVDSDLSDELICTAYGVQRRSLLIQIRIISVGRLLTETLSV